MIIICSYQLLCEFFIYYGENCTGTFLHFVEKAGLIQRILPQITNISDNSEFYKRFYLGTAHFYKY